jgi:hypothetical protein
LSHYWPAAAIRIATSQRQPVVGMANNANIMSASWCRRCEANLGPIVSREAN